MRNVNKAVLAAAVAAGALSAFGSARADTVIGNWEQPFVGTGGPSSDPNHNAVGGDGWMDWMNIASYSQSTIGATNGTHSVKVATPVPSQFGAYEQDLT